MTQSISGPGRQPRPDFLKVLGLSFPILEEEVEQAYRAKVWAVHPDRGGDAARFHELQQAYEKARELARFGASRRRWLASSIERYVEQRKLIDTIEQFGGEVEVQSFDWLAAEIGQDFAQVLEQITVVRLRGPRVDDAAIDRLVQASTLLTQVHHLDLSGSRVTDQGVLRLQSLPHLRQLDLSDTQVSNDGLRVLNDLVELEWLGLAGTQVSWLGRLQLGWSRPFLMFKTAKTTGMRASWMLFQVTLALLLIYLLALLLATHVPFRRPDVPRLGVGLDKIVHAMMYAGLAFLSMAILRFGSTRPQPLQAGLRWTHVLLWLVLALLGLLDEWTQPLTGRTFDWWDWVADLVGITLGIALFQLAMVAISRLVPNVWRLTPAEQAAIENRRAIRQTVL